MIKFILALLFVLFIFYLLIRALIRFNDAAELGNWESYGRENARRERAIEKAHRSIGK